MSTAEDTPEARIAEWRGLFDRSLLRRERHTESVSLYFRDEPGMRERLEDLSGREHTCCPFLDFRIETVDDELIWTTSNVVTGDERADIDRLLDAFYALPDHAAADRDGLPNVAHRFIEVDGNRLFYREAGPPNAPTILLLHGFPTASHQFTRLIDALGSRYRLIAPDYPGFGHSDAPEPASVGGPFEYTFDRLAETIEGFCEQLGLDRFVMYMFDFGAPVGFRLATRHPEWIGGLVVQNANAYEAGLSPMAQALVAARREDGEAEAKIRQILTPSAIRDQYLHGAGDPEAIAPDGWTLDHHFLEPPDRQQIQVDLAFDYHTNVELYPRWQSWLREHRPPTLVVWGRNDPFFVEAGALAYAGDVPDAEVHLLDTGHFALEDRLQEIAPLIASFVDRRWSPAHGIESVSGSGSR
jgi:pimeloyl-ACP methyl ester carboxylesterase